MTTHQPDQSPKWPIPAPTVDARASRTSRSRRAGRTRALLVSGAVVTSLVGTGAFVAATANGAATTGSGTSTTSSPNAANAATGSSHSSSTQSSLVTHGSSSSSHATTSGS